MKKQSLEFLKELRGAVESSEEGLGCYGLANNCAIGVLLTKRGYGRDDLVDFEYLSRTAMNRKLGLSLDSRIVEEVARVNDELRGSRIERKYLMLTWIDAKIKKLQR